MPPRPPPSPPVLTVLCCIAAAAATWVALAADRLGRGAVLALLGIPIGQISITRRGHYLLTVEHGATVALGPWAYALVVAAGTVVVVVSALALQAAVERLRAPGWLRGFSLAFLVVALMWVPFALTAGAVRGGGGPAADLYARLGRPQAGRWTVLALGMLLLVVAAGAISEQALAAGRGWMRADGLAFRRRLVRVVAGWPAVTAAVALGVAGGWAASPWQAVIPAAVMLALHIRTG